MRQILLLLLLTPFLVFAKATKVTGNLLVYNYTDHTVIHGTLNNDHVSIASISKLMTVYTVLKAEQNLDEQLTVVSSRLPNTKLNKGMRVTRRELIDLALISSDNIAAMTLAENFPRGRAGFVDQMNYNALELHMTNTGFVEPTGLSPMNYSTMTDLLNLTKIVSDYEIIKNAARTQKEIKVPVEITVKQKKKKVEKTKSITSRPTSKYFGREGIIIIKTGYTRAAGYCITMIVEHENKLYNITVLGSKSPKHRQQLIEKALEYIVE